MSAVAEGAEILVFDGATVACELDGVDHLVLDAALEAGGLWLVESETVEQERSFFDAAIGLLSPVPGRVLFRGHDWSAMPRTFSDALRGQIGFVARGGTVLPYADMAANILLGARFHRREPDDLLLADARRLAVRFGLPGLPAGLVEQQSRLDLLRASCVRAFLGEPSLILIESQPQPWRADLVPPVVDAMREMRERGGAAIWCVQDDALFADPSMPVTARFRLRGRTLRMMYA